MLPAAVAVLIAAFSLAAGPSGLIAIAALIAGARSIVQIAVRRAPKVGVVGQIAPILASGTVVLVAVFADQTLASVLEATRVRTAVGPNVAWFDERVRWDALLNVSPDGSLARRFAVFAMLLCLIVCILMLLRRGGKIPGTAIGPSRRILGIIFASLLLMSFTPTKWTHHFGVYAGLAGSVAALAAVAVAGASLRSKRNRTLFAAAVLFILTMSFTGPNGWWYVSSYGVPWWDKPPSIGGKGFSTALLGLTVLALLLAAWFHIREPYERARDAKNAGTAAPNGNGRLARIRRWSPAPLTLAAAAVVLFEVLSLLKGAVAQYPSYSIAHANLRSAAGNSCALADYVLVEDDTNASVLRLLDQPTDLAGAGAFGATAATGFTADGVARDLTADKETVATGGANSVDADSDSGQSTTGTGAGTGGGTEASTGVNGSSVSLPFGLSPATTPVLGSYQSGAQESAELVTGWYGLPDRSDDAPILTIAAADASTPSIPTASSPTASYSTSSTAPGRRTAASRPSAASHPSTSDRHRRGGTCGCRSTSCPPARTPSARRVRHRARPRPVAGRHPAARTAHADPADRRRQQRTRAARLVGGPGVPVPAPVRAPGRRRRDPRVPHPARPGGRPGHQRVAGRDRWRTARLDAVAAERRDHPDLPGRRLAAGLGFPRTIHPDRRIGAARAGGCRADHPVGPVVAGPDPGDPTRLTSL